MTSAPSAKPGVGKKNLLPFYVGLTEGKDLKNKPSKHTHYVLIDERVATRLGIKGKGSSKPGAADTLSGGVIFQNNRSPNRVQISNRNFQGSIDTFKFFCLGETIFMSKCISKIELKRLFPKDFL